MRLIKSIQTYADNKIECPKCFSEEVFTDIKTAKHGLISRDCKNCNHDWLDEMNLKDWRTLKRWEGSQKSGNINQHKNNK